jgi:hypothetical protein
MQIESVVATCGEMLWWQSGASDHLAIGRDLIINDMMSNAEMKEDGNFKSRIQGITNA